MRLRKNRLKQIALKKFESIKDSEGGIQEGFSSSFVLIKCEIWPASNKRQVEIYGIRINDILNMNYQGAEQVNVGDGLCIYVESSKNPDYRVISKKEYTSHFVYEIEKI